jgi:transposase
MEAYSIDLRERVVAACDEGTEIREETAERLCVSTSFIRKLLRRRRQTGSIAAKPHAGGGRPSLGKADLRQVRRLVDEKPDATLAELCRRLATRTGRRVRPWTMCRALQKLKLPRKKSRYMPASGTRRAFRSCVGLGLRRSSGSRPGS